LAGSRPVDRALQTLQHRKQGGILSGEAGSGIRLALSTRSR
jgi:hypothetical protein